MNAAQQAKLRKEVEGAVLKAQPDLTGEALEKAVQDGVTKRLADARQVTPAVTKAQPAKAIAPAATKQAGDTAKASAPEGWKPVDNSHKTGVALRYSRRSRNTGHVINIWDSKHDDTPAAIKKASGEGRYVVEDTVTHVTKRADQWNMAYTMSRTIDGGTIPDTTKYLRPWQSKLAKNS